MSDKPFRLMIVAPNDRLYEKVQAAARLCAYSVPMVQVCSWDRAMAMAKQFPGSVLLVQWQSNDVPPLLPNMAELHRRLPNVTLAVFVPDLPNLPVSLGESLRLSMFESGATMVLGSPRELPTLLAVTKRCESRVPVPEMSITERIWNALPFKPPISPKRERGGNSL